jgi:hypothetical protein
LVNGNTIIFLPEGIADYVFVEPGDWEANLGLNSMVLYWQNMAGKKFNGSVTYTRGNESYKIPITIDYTT